MLIRKTFLSLMVAVYLLFGFLAMANTASAAIFKPFDMLGNQDDAFISGAGYEEEVSVGSLAATIISALLSLLGLIFLGLIIYAGYNWMTAGGEEEKIKKSTDTIKRALIGLIITLSAYAITYFVFNNFFSGQFSGSGGSSPVGTATENQ